MAENAKGRVNAEVLGEMNQAAKQTGLSTADVMRQSAKIGLPKLLGQMGAGRITNVVPLPDKIARALYSQPEEDADSIRTFMEARSNTVHE
jgi:hypothetical protein